MISRFSSSRKAQHAGKILLVNNDLLGAGNQVGIYEEQGVKSNKRISSEIEAIVYPTDQSSQRKSGGEQRHSKSSSALSNEVVTMLLSASSVRAERLPIYTV